MSKKIEYPSQDKSYWKNMGLLAFLVRHVKIPKVSITLLYDFCTIGRRKNPVINIKDLTVSRQQLKDDSKLCAKALLHFGIKKGDIVSVCSMSIYQVVVIFFACNRIGATCAIMDNHIKFESLINELKSYGSKILFVFDKDENFALSIKKNTKVKHVINISKENINCPFCDTNEELSNKDFISWNYLKKIDNIDKIRLPKIAHYFWGDLSALILYTSGSTGEPKRIVITNRNIVSAMAFFGCTGAKIADKSLFWCLSLVHFMYPYGFICSVLFPVSWGLASRLAFDFNENNVDYYLGQENNVVFSVPAILHLIKNNLSKDIKLKDLNVVISGGDYLSEEFSITMLDFFKQQGASNVQLCNSAGNGEVLGCATLSYNVEYRPDTVGKLLPGPKYLIIKNDKDFEEAKYYEDGEMFISGTHVFKKYFDNENASNASKVMINNDEYYKTGMYGHLDTKGFFTLTGRASRFYIIRLTDGSWRKVYCEHVQKYINKIEFVESCAIVPHKDKKEENFGRAFIVLKHKYNNLDRKDLQKTIMQLLNTIIIDDRLLKQYEFPKYITFIDTLPLTPAKKVNFSKLEKLPL